MDRLLRAHLLDRRALDALVLARHRVDPRDARRLQVAAAHGLHAVLGQSRPEPGPARLAGAGGRLPLLGRRHPHDPLGDAGGAARGLHPHRPRQGADAEADPVPPRAQERDAAGAHGDRARVRLPHRRSRGHRAGVQPQRHRSALRAGGGAPRLHAAPGARDAGGRVLHHRELPDGHRVRVARPADPVSGMRGPSSRRPAWR